jgi:2-dehydro-3-deoxygluconokinase
MSAIAAVGEGLFELGLGDGEQVRRGFGGDAPNSAVMAALAGADARICGRVGDDALGRLLLDFWSRCGVDTRFVVVDAGGPTGIYVCETSPAGHRYDYHRTASAGSRLRPDDVTRTLLEGVGTVHFTGITLSISASAADAARAAQQRARAQGARVSFAVNYRPALEPDVSLLLAAARSADVVFVSRDEAELLVGESEPGRIADALSVGSRTELIVTSGSGGAAVLTDGAWSAVPAPSVTVVDAGGAGDALAGCYLAERSRGRPAADALRVAIVAASLSCMGAGCAASYPQRAELDAALN